MEKIEIKRVLNKAFVFLLTFTFGIFYSATPPAPPVRGGYTPGAGTPQGPGAKPTTPVDMYEGILVGIAVVLIIGYYFYSRNKRVANS